MDKGDVVLEKRITQIPLNAALLVKLRLLECAPEDINTFGIATFFLAWNDYG